MRIPIEMVNVGFSLAPALTRSLTAGMLVLGDRGLVSFDLWRAMAQTGADLLWRTRTNAVLPVVQTLPDGSYRSQIVAARDHRHGRDPITVRVVEYHLQDPGRVLHRQHPVVDQRGSRQASRP